jgi:hypothetical protein
VRVALRAAAPFALTEKLKVALPAPEVPDVTVIHDGIPPMVQVQADAAVNETAPVPPTAVNAALVGESVASAHRLAACVTVKLLPAAEKVALRSAPAFAAAVMLSVALPLPDCVIVIHDGRPVTVHAHPKGAVMDTVEFPPLTVKLRLAGEIVGVGTHTLAAWLMTTLRFAMAIVALRAPPGFVATV